MLFLPVHNRYSITYDTETGLYYLRSRYYDPEVGRFLNADGYLSTGTGISGFNMFAYCNNNPVVYSDSEGKRPLASTTVANESAEERKVSCQHMQQCSLAATPLPSAPKSNNTPNSVINDINAYINNFISAVEEAFYLQFGMGFGYGGSISSGYTEIEAQIYFNPANFKYKVTGTQYYSSFYVGAKIVDAGRVIGLEYHIILDWDTGELYDISADPVRFDDLGIGFSAYKHMGIDFFVGVE